MGIRPTGAGGAAVPAGGARLGIIGTSLVQQNEVATSTKISHSSRGWLSWARFFSRDRFICPIWHDQTAYAGWEPSGVPGATRSFRGLNAGVSGQTIAQITSRQRFLLDNVSCDWVMIDAGTNDMGPLSKEAIHASRIALAKLYLAAGKRVILLPILSRSVSSWSAGGAERKKAAWLNQQARSFCAATPHCYLYDWNARWVDSASANGEPIAGFSNDGTHWSVPGGVDGGEGFAAFVAKLMPDPAPRVWSADDTFDATHNPLGNLLANQFCTGAGGTPVASAATGQVANGMRVERSTGTATIACSKEARPDNRGDWQVLAITPGASDSLSFFRPNAADTVHALPAGTWVQGSIEVEIGSWSGWQGITLYMKDNGVGGLLAYGMEPFDDGAGYIRLPARVMNGLIVTPPIQLVAGSASIRWRVEVRTAGGVAGAGTLKVGALELRPVADPRQVVGYSAG